MLEGPRYGLEVRLLPGLPGHDIARENFGGEAWGDYKHICYSPSLSDETPRRKAEEGSHHFKDLPRGKLFEKIHPHLFKRKPLGPHHKTGLTALRPVQQPRVIRRPMRPAVLRKVSHPCNAIPPIDTSRTESCEWDASPAAGQQTEGAGWPTS